MNANKKKLIIILIYLKLKNIIVEFREIDEI